MSIGYISFKLNCDYYLWMLYKDNIDPRSKSKFADKVSAKLRELIIVCQKNLHCAQKRQKRTYNKSIKLKSYAFSNKALLNSKYIKAKKN